LDPRYLLVLLCFFVSGFAGLLYQTAWTREFSFVFGTSNLAVATVLAAYMGGLSLGAALAARFMHRIRRPVLAYGLLELGIAASALAVPSLIRAVTLLYRPLFATAEILPEQGGLASAIFYGVASFLILGIPTTLMGATLPMLARQAVREEAQIGGRIGTLYAVNTAGAIAGTVATAFVLLPQLGLRDTVWVGAGLNALVFAAAAALARGAGAVAAGPRPSRAEGLGGRARLVLAVAFGSSVASFVYENLWFRLFEHVLGTSIYAFSAMLASFLLGIALGGALAAPLARTQDGSARGLALSQLGTALFSFLAFLLVDRVPDVVQQVSQAGVAGQLARASVAAALLLPSTLCIGASFPFAVRALADRVEVAAAASARVYAWNTLGAIVGSIAAGFWVIPQLGFERALVAAALLNVLVASIAAALPRPLPRRVLAAAAASALAFLVLRPGPPWRVLGASGLGAAVGMGGEPTPVDPEKVLYFRAGRSSTVLLLEEEGGFRLRNNGLPESLIQARGAPPGMIETAHWLSLLPAFAAPSPELLVIGLGGGVVIEDLPATFERADVIELEPRVVEANRRVADLRRRDPLSDPRVRILVNDARGALQLTTLRYGAIVSQPSHPWTAGASHLYTRDFFEQVRQRLQPGGVFVQWMGLSFVDRELLASLIASLLDVFPYLRAYHAELGSLIFVASETPLDLEARVDEVVARDPLTFARHAVRVREDLAAALVLDEAGARAFSEGAPLTTDDRNFFATDSPYMVERPMLRTGPLFARYDPLVKRAAEFEGPYLVQLLAGMGREARARRVAAALPSPRDRLLAETEIALARGLRRKALRLALQALELDPQSPRARFRASMLQHAEGGADPLRDATAELVRRSQVLRKARDWDALARLEAALAAIELRHPAHQEASRLRVEWRLGRATPEDGAEALALLDQNLWSGMNDYFAQRARAGSVSGEAGVAERSLERLALALRSGRRARLSPLGAEWALAALDATPSHELSAEANALRPRLARLSRRSGESGS
jgi:spermidine synthase